MEVCKEKHKRLEEKIDVFYATGKITEAEYNELMAMLGGA